jgi:pyruvate/2-oxoglutarate dehydrogenase complex dihydrolipoamide dehydrogenase (E3) component
MAPWRARTAESASTRRRCSPVLAVTQIEQPPEALPTVDHEIGALVHAELVGHGVKIGPGTTKQRISRDGNREVVRMPTSQRGTR